MIVSLVSSSITSFRRITTWEESAYPSESMLFLQLPLPSHCQIEAALQWEPTTDDEILGQLLGQLDIIVNDHSLFQTAGGVTLTS